MADDDLNKKKKLIEDLRKEYERISGLTPPKFDVGNDVKEANAALRTMNDLIDTVSTDIGDISTSFKSVVEEIRKSNEGLSMSTNAFNKLSKMAQKLKDNQEGLSELSLDDLQNLKKQAFSERQRLKQSKDLLNTKKRDLLAVKNRSKAQEKELDKTKSALGEINGLLQGQDGSFKSLLVTIQKQTKATKNLKEATGAVGAGVDGIDQALRKTGFSGFADNLNLKGALEDGVKKAKELTNNGKKAATPFQKLQIGATTAGSAFKNIGKSLMKGGPIVLGLTLLIKTLIFFKDAMFAASKQIAEFQRNFAMSRDEASALRDRTNDIAGASGTLLLTQKQINQSLKEMNSSLGIAFDFTSRMGNEGVKLLQDFSKLRDNFGISGEALKGLTEESIRTGESIENISEEILGQTAFLGVEKGVMLDMNGILEEVGKTSGNIRANFAGGAKELANAVIQSRYLGLTLAQSDKMASSLLDFEGSIASELEAELLLGKQLNLEKARSLALDNDIVGATKELMRQTGSYSEFINMNRLQREAIAKSVGLSSDELADSLRKQEELNRLGGVALLLGKKTDALQKMSLANIFAEAKALKKSRKEIIQILGKETYERKLAEDASARFAKAMDRVKEVFSSLVDGGILDSFARGLTEFSIRMDEEGMFEAITGIGVDSARTKNRINEANERLAKSLEENTKSNKELLALNKSNNGKGMVVKADGTAIGQVVGRNINPIQ